jgi:ribosomal protein L14
MWLQTRSKVTIKDNSGFVKGRVVNALQKKQTRFSKIKVAITQSKWKRDKSRHKLQNSKLQNAFVLFTKKPVVRFDGSTIRFNLNSVVTVSDSKTSLGFQTVNTCVPFEVKRSLGRGRGGANLIKMAKALL